MSSALRFLILPGLFRRAQFYVTFPRNFVVRFVSLHFLVGLCAADGRGEGKLLGREGGGGEEEAASPSPPLAGGWAAPPLGCGPAEDRD